MHVFMDYQNIQTEIWGGGKRKYVYIIVLAVNGKVAFGEKVDHPDFQLAFKIKIRQTQITKFV